jgi:hypothetical protein
MTFATWMLTVTLLAPTFPEEHRAWDMRYGPMETIQECELLAGRKWSAFYNRYPSLPGQLNTLCQAREHGRTWWSSVVCDRTGNCEIKKGQM